MLNTTYKVAKFTDHENLRDGIDTARAFRVTEVNRQVKAWQELERGQRMESYRSTTYIKDLEDYTSPKSRIWKIFGVGPFTFF